MWDSVPEGDPVLLGAVEVPSDVLQNVLSSSSRRDQDATRTRAVRSDSELAADEDQRRESKGSRGSSDLHLFSLDLRPRQDGEQPQNQQRAGIVRRESGATATVVAAKAARDDATTEEAEHSGAVGVLSFSLKRVVSDAERSDGEEGLNHPQASAEDARLDQESGSVAGPGKEAMETRTSEVKSISPPQCLRLLFCRCSRARSCTGYAR